MRKLFERAKEHDGLRETYEEKKDRIAEHKMPEPRVHEQRAVAERAVAPRIFKKMRM